MDREDVKSIVYITSIAAALLAISFAFIVLYSVTISRSMCEGYNHTNMLHFRWEWPAGCMVETRQGYWLPIDKYDWHAFQSQPTY